MTIDDIRKGLLQKIQQVGQGFGQLQKNPIGKSIVQVASQASPITSAIAHNNSFASAFSQVPKVNFTQNVQNPFLKALAGIPESIVNSPMNTAQGIQGLNKNISDIYTRGKVEPRNILANAGRTADFPLNFMTGGQAGTITNTIRNQGFQQLKEQGLKQILKEGALSGGKLGLAFGAAGGFQSGENITNPLEYAKNLSFNTAVGGITGAGIGAVGGGLGYGLNKGQIALDNSFKRQILEDFSSKVQKVTPDSFKGFNKSVVKPFRNAFAISGKTESEVRDAVVKFQGGMIGDDIANKTLELSTQKYLPRFANLDTTRQAAIWDYLLARKHNQPALTVPPELQALDNEIFRVHGIAIKQGGKFNPLADVSTGKNKIETQQSRLQKEQASSLLSQDQNILNPSSESVPQLKGYTQKGSFTNTKEDLIAPQFRQTSDTPSLQAKTAEDISLQSPQQSPTAVTRQPLQNQSDSLISSKDSSTNSIHRTVKDDFEAEMDALVGKPLNIEKTFKGKSKIKSKEPIDLPGDQTSTDFATGRSAMGGNGIKGLPQESSDQFQAWVNRRRATELEGFLKKKEFKDLDNKKIEGIFEFQSGNKSGRFGDVKKYFDTKYKTLQDNKIEFDYRQDYLPQLWNNSQDEINQVFGKRLGMKPSFTLEALFKSYQEGIDAGLKPKFNNISDLVGWYEQKANKALADKKFFDYLGSDGQILPSGKAPQEWVTLNPDHFPKFLSKIGDEKFAGTYKAPKELADVINNYLQGARLPFLENVANYVSRVKNITLNFGIPGTGINMHGINILARHSLMGTGGNPVSRFITGGKYMLAPNLAKKELDKSLIRGPQAIKDGLSLSAEDYSGLQKVGTTFAQKFGKKWDDAFGGPLFEKMIPALKLSSYEELVKNGMDGKDAAKLVNNVYGGINWEQMGRSKDMQNLLRAVILAPDWAETTLRLGGNLAKSANLFRNDKVSRRYQTMMATILASYVAHNVTNKLTSGHYSYENEPTNMFNIQVGYTEDGDKRYLRPYGTGLDMVRLPTEIAMGLVKGDLTGITRLLRNRLSIPAGVALGVLTDQDYRGDAIGYRGTDKYGNQMPLDQRTGNITSEAASLVGVPAFTRQLYKSASGQQGLEQGLTQGFELPFRYQSGGNSKTQKFVGDVSGAKGQELFDLKQKFQGESPFSENQKAMINQGGMPALEAVMNQRIVTRQSNQIKEVQKKAASGEISPEEAQKSMKEILKQPVKTPTQSNSGVNQAHAADNGVFEYNNKYSYIDKTGKTTNIDINPPSKGNGIDAFANKDWNITKARSVWNSPLPENTKDEIYKKLGVDKADVRYDALAHHNTDVSTQYILSKSADHVALLKNIITGRQESISGTQFASNGVIDNLVEQGELSKEEAKQLKALKFDKNGQSIGKSTSKAKKGKKLPLRAVKKANFKIATKQSNAKTIKSGKPTKIKTPNVSFDTQFSKKGSIPQAKKYQVKFNV